MIAPCTRVSQELGPAGGLGLSRRGRDARSSDQGAGHAILRSRTQAPSRRSVTAKRWHSDCAPAWRRPLTSGLRIVEGDRAATGTDYDLAFLGAGINDVWRRLQNRMPEAVDLDEYTRHFDAMLDRLGGYTRTIIVVSETPFGPVEDPGTVAAMNTELALYNDAARAAAAAYCALFPDVWTPFTAAARHLAGQRSPQAEGFQESWRSGQRWRQQTGEEVLGQLRLRVQLDHLAPLLDLRPLRFPRREEFAARDGL
ncbi:SGNH/GDSL hydrolase family protein [Streptomyces sp. Wb2n-11]|uniref:SGNH/GDSL hydrolase family protein n=1 Tax=Streptomyces sp. Wb2n-11 TaxID=1030533 RepID=UPI000A81EC0B|nr:SGNH/GDSL hydrolase family protein [Streptomyces sp. Wb2n-11]